MKYYFLLSCFFILLFSCDKNVNSSTEKSTAPPTKVTNSNIEKLPSVPLALLQKLYDKCDYVDYLFYDSNFSMSMNNDGSIKQTLTHVSQGVPVLDKPCKPIGRVFYEINGETEIEAEIFFSNECQHFIFMKNNKRLYANNITPDGVAHFQNVFKQAGGLGK